MILFIRNRNFYKFILAYVYFNGCLNFPNLIISYPAGSGSIFGRGYTLDFWIKIDRVNEFCTQPAGTLKYYFIGDPHAIYFDPNDTSTTAATQKTNLGYNIYYQLFGLPNSKVKLVNFSQFNWNHISIHVDLVNRNLRVYTNFNFYYPEVKLDNIPSGVDISFNRLVFCSKSSCITSGYFNNIFWGAAYYKDLKINDGINYNPFASVDDYSSMYFSFFYFVLF